MAMASLRFNSLWTLHGHLFSPIPWCGLDGFLNYPRCVLVLAVQPSLSWDGEHPTAVGNNPSQDAFNCSAVKVKNNNLSHCSLSSSADISAFFSPEESCVMIMWGSLWFLICWNLGPPVTHVDAVLNSQRSRLNVNEACPPFQISTVILTKYKYVIIYLELKVIKHFKAHEVVLFLSALMEVFHMSHAF